MQSSSSLAGPTYVLVTIATLMLQLALYDRQGASPQEWFQLAFVLAVSIALRYKSRFDRERTREFISVAGFAALVAAPIVWDTFGRQSGRYGNPFEIQVALTLRNMMIGLAVGVCDKRSLVFASLASCFLALFSLLWLMNHWTIAFLIAYTITGMWWLLGAYWDRLSDCFMTHSERAIPWKPVLCATACAGLITVLMFPLVNGEYYTTAIQGFLPSSGGTGSQDEYAFGGVGDGPQMVSAKENASSFGPIESELFLESKMPSLYDVFNEFSDTPPKPKKRKQLRAIPHRARTRCKRITNVEVQPRRLVANSALFRKTEAKEDTYCARFAFPCALLQVAGRVPVHLGLYAYDMWDGHKTDVV